MCVCAQIYESALLLHLGNFTEIWKLELIYIFPLSQVDLTACLCSDHRKCVLHQYLVLFHVGYKLKTEPSTSVVHRYFLKL